MGRCPSTLILVVAELGWGRRWQVLFQKDKGHVFFYLTDIPYSMCTIRGTNLIPWCYLMYLLEDLHKYFRVRAAGLKPFIVSLGSLQCYFCIGCTLSLNNNGKDERS